MSLIVVRSSQGLHRAVAVSARAGENERQLHVRAATRQWYTHNHIVVVRIGNNLSL